MAITKLRVDDLTGVNEDLEKEKKCYMAMAFIS